MRARSLLLCAGFVCSLSAADPGLTQIRSVYLLPMTAGLDQYLANQLTRTGRFQVVTDPARADAVFTDRIGADFEGRMLELYPPPKPEPDEDEEKAEAKDKDQGTSEQTIGAALAEKAGSSTGRLSSFSRSKGTVFLVDRISRQVVWSYYTRARSTGSDDMNHTADQIVGKLNDDVKHVMTEAAKAEKKSGQVAAPKAATPEIVQPAAPAAAPAPAPVAPKPSTPAAPPPAGTPTPATTPQPQTGPTPPASK